MAGYCGRMGGEKELKMEEERMKRKEAVPASGQEMQPAFDIEELAWNEQGLIPAIVQDYYSKKVLMMAWMNRESLLISAREKMTCFYSRSRRELWRKGETSGNRQHISSIYADCDRDTLIVEVIKEGPACHTGAESCFFECLCQNEEIPPFSLDGLYEMILGRKSDPREGSYTSYLFERGMDKILKKVGEESTEVIIAAAKGDREETVYEIADLCYHILVLMGESGIRPEDVTRELAKRHVVDRKVKQEYMK